MGMSAQDMVDAIRGHQSGIVPSPNEGPAQDSAYADKMLLALCQGVIDEIIAGAVVTTTSGAPDGEHSGNVSS